MTHEGYGRHSGYYITELVDLVPKLSSHRCEEHFPMPNIDIDFVTPGIITHQILTLLDSI